MQRTKVLAITSDQHVNSTLGLCPQEGVQLDDGGFYTPSLPQRWTWARWLAFWRRVNEVRREQRADLLCVYNGDAVDGDHHQTSQIISRNMEVQGYVASRVFGVPAALKPERQFLVRGTEVHVGQSGSSEESLAKSLRCERDPDTRNWSHWHLRLEIHGYLFDFQHHATSGGLPWTRAGNVSRLAFRHCVEAWRRGLPPADFLFRSHLHVYNDSHGAEQTRAIITPAWQLKTAHAHKVAPESIADIGGIIVTIPARQRGTGRLKRRPTVEVVLYQPAPPRPWKLR